MADPLREALAALAEQWSRFGRGDPLDPWTAHAADLRDLLAAHPEPVRCRACGGSGLRLNASGYREPCEGCDPEPAEPPAPEGAVRVRIAVAVDAEGDWSASGRSGHRGKNAATKALYAVNLPARLSWVEAWVPRPEAEQAVEGRVAPEGE